MRTWLRVIRDLSPLELSAATLLGMLGFFATQTNYDDPVWQLSRWVEQIGRPWR